MSGDVSGAKLPYEAKYLKDQKASCNKCNGLPIQGELLLGTRVYNSGYIYFGTRWFHFACFFDVMRERREELNEESIMGMDLLNRDHQETIRVQIGRLNEQLLFDTIDLSSWWAEHNMGGRSKCATCKKNIKEGEAKCHRNREHHHIGCFFREDMLFMGSIESIQGYDGLNQETKIELKVIFDSHKSSQNSYPSDPLLGDIEEQVNFNEESICMKEETLDWEEIPFNALPSPLNTKDEALEDLNHDDQILISSLPYPKEEPKEEGWDEYQIPPVDFANEANFSKNGEILNTVMPRSELINSDMSLKEEDDLNDEIVPNNAPPCHIITKEEPLNDFDGDIQIPISSLPYPNEPKEEPLDESRISHQNFAEDELMIKEEDMLNSMMPRPDSVNVRVPHKEKDSLHDEIISNAEKKRRKNSKLLELTESWKQIESEIDTSIEPVHSRKVFIGGFTKRPDKLTLCEYFGKFGQLTDLLIIDERMYRSGAYAFLTYAAKSMADECQKASPHTISSMKLESKRAAARDTSQVSSRRLFVKGIREDHTENMLQEYFKMFGSIEKVVIKNIVNQAANESHRFALVSFKEDGFIDECLLLMWHYINGHKCKVEDRDSKRFVKSLDNDMKRRENISKLLELTGHWKQIESEIDTSIEPVHSRKVFIGGLSKYTDKLTMCEYFGKFGQLTDLLIVSDYMMLKKGAFAFVTYAAKSMVDECQNSNPHTITRLIIESKRAAAPAINSPCRRLLVSGIYQNHTENMLQRYFEMFGNVETVSIEKETSEFHGCAFVSFKQDYFINECLLLKSHFINRCEYKVEEVLWQEEKAQREAEQKERDRAAFANRSFTNRRNAMGVEEVIRFDLRGIGRGGGPFRGGPQQGGGYRSQQGWPGYGTQHGGWGEYGYPGYGIPQGGVPGYGTPHVPGYGTPQGGVPGYGTPHVPVFGTPHGGWPGYGTPQGGVPGYGTTQGGWGEYAGSYGPPPALPPPQPQQWNGYVGSWEQEHQHGFDGGNGGYGNGQEPWRH